MRIAMIGWEFPPFSSGGLSAHCVGLTRELAKKGVETDFFMPKTKHAIACDWMNVIQVDYVDAREYGLVFGPYGVVAGRSESGGIERSGSVDASYGLDFFSAVARYNELAALAVLKRHEERNYDLVHCHDWITVKAGIAVKEKSGLPLVFTVHSTEFDRTANIGACDWILDKEREGLEKANAVITVSQMMKSQLTQRFGVGQEKIDVVYNAVDAKRFELRQVEKRFWKKIVLYHGRLSIQKGPDYFLKAAKLVAEKEPKTLFIISGEGSMMPQLVDLAIELGIENKVLFAGYIPEEKLPSVYAVSDVYVLPSVSEPFGISVLEAMASGKPVIVSKTSGVSEIAKNVFLTDFWDTQKMAEQMIFLLNRPRERKRLSKKLREECEAFSWSSAADKTLSVYEKVLESNKNA